MNHLTSPPQSTLRRVALASALVFVTLAWSHAAYADPNGTNQASTTTSGPQTLYKQVVSNTIIVKSGRDIWFEFDVLSALKAICPCLIISLDGNDGEISLKTPVLPQGGTDPEFCTCYCRHKAGCNLILNLSLHSRTTKIKPSYSTNRHKKGTVKWNPERRSGGKQENGSRERPPYIGLAHEMIHARHYALGTHDSTELPNRIRPEEIVTVRGENQIRAEKGKPRRTHYSCKRVPNPDAHNIDESNKYSGLCDC